MFSVPSGKAGKQFLRELTHLFNAYAQASALESIALKACVVACALLLQKPHFSSKSKDHVKALERRLNAWRAGDIDGLLREGRTIQNHLTTHRSKNSEEQWAHNIRVFTKLVLEGKIHSALRFLSMSHGSGILDLDDPIENLTNNNYTVLDALKDKHPKGRNLNAEALVTTTKEPPLVHPILFESLNGSAIRAAALRTQGAAGLSGVDAAGWRRMCASFHKESTDLCEAIAALARRICTEPVDPTGLQAFLSCRLIPLNKNPGVRPIGVCEVIRRIVGKALLGTIKNDVLKSAGPFQLCAGQEAGAEAAIHAMRTVFNEETTDAVLFVDASNAFNNLNRKVALHNIQFVCPQIATALINCYRQSSHLFVGGRILLSDEGTTQGDPLAMAMFALATVPLIRKIAIPGSVQAWFADDSASGGKLTSLRQWWDLLSRNGPNYGYYPNAKKTFLLVKNAKKAEAGEVFKDTGVQITTEGRPYLGGPLGSTEFVENFLEKKVSDWEKEIQLLAKFAVTQPQASFAALTHGIISRWAYSLRVISPSAAELLQPLEDAIRQRLIPSITAQPPVNEALRNLLALPSRLGGMGIVNPVTMTATQYDASREITQPLVSLILQQNDRDLQKAQQVQHLKKRQLRLSRREKLKNTATSVLSELPNSLRQCAIAAQEKGVSSWLAALPLEQHGFSLSKREFYDALALRYGWPVCGVPQSCACGQPFSVSHALICRCGGYIGHRHDQLRDLTADLLQEVCPNVTVEPLLQPLHGEQLGRSANTQDSARLDIRATGFWTSAQDAFFDVRVFYPFASSYQNSQLASVYKQHESKKRLEYGRRVREVERGTFTPLVFTTGGGMAGEATIFFKRLASLLSEKRNEPYSITMGWLRCVISFSLLKSSIRSVRGTRKKLHGVPTDNVIEVATSSRLQI